MQWAVLMADEFEPEFLALERDVQDEILALTRLLQQFGPNLGRPRVDTLKDSRHRNMKELRFDAANGAWRLAFALDPNAGPFCWWRATNRAGARSGSTAS